MRLLLVVPMVPQAEGAGAIPELLHAQVAGLRELHDVTVLGTYGDLRGQAEAAERLRRSGLDAVFVDRRRSASAVRRWRVRAELASSWARRRWPWRTVSTAGGVQPELDRLASTRAFDVIAVEDTPMSVLRFPQGVPRVLTEHEAQRAPAPSWRGGGPAGSPLGALRAHDRRRWDGFQRVAWERFGLLQVFSRGDAEWIAQRSPGVAPRVRVNPFGLVLEEPVDPALEDPGLLLFVGTFTHAPNRDAALWLAREILPLLAEREPSARLRIVGTAVPGAIRSLAGPRIEVVADAPSVRPHMEAAVVVLAPVRTGGGMRMKVLQALAAGKAVVTTSRGAEGFDTLEPDPPFAVADSAEGIAAATADLLAAPQRRREMAAAGRDFAERHHSPASWARRLTAVYEEARRGVPSSS
jgi:glycosyltransferase involved in cell wall biosynthesis